MRGEKPKKVRWHKKANVVKISIYLGVLTKWRARIYICTFHPTHGKTTIATSLSLLLIFHIFVLFIFQPSELSESITVTSHPSSHTHTLAQGENEKNFRSEKNPAFHIPFFTGNPCLNIITLSIINRVDFFCSLSRCSTLFFYSLYPFFCHQKNAYLGTGFWLKIKDIFFGYIYGAQNSRIWSIWFNSSCYVSLRGADFENVSIWLNIKNSINFNYINHCYEAVCKN